ncbi:hypothetical protein PAPYR_9308 [Paratrimastix pyriformis]|uniref:Uncharacterized protein n=1 Tax=Paratrimastix pyriformis TaxID=342808 RepID=A0ABQ8UB81_9EUKA|nr:hypothetical protein PAPYR_9308 [Paratrimastix pyriformis]
MVKQMIWTRTQANDLDSNDNSRLLCSSMEDLGFTMISDMLEQVLEESHQSEKLWVRTVFAGIVQVERVKMDRQESGASDWS